MTHPRQPSPLRIAANRRNAQKSTGPKSLAGKRRSALNALRHGLCPRAWERELRGWREDPREFCRLHRDLIAILRPCDGSTRRLVECLARTWWEKARRIRNWPSSRPIHTEELDERLKELLLAIVRLQRSRHEWWIDRLQSVLGELGSPEKVQRDIESRLFIFGAQPGRRKYPPRPAREARLTARLEQIVTRIMAGEAPLPSESGLGSPVSDRRNIGIECIPALEETSEAKRTQTA